ncbi:MAG: hypothetical protein OEU86_05350, partial [Gammaproteobacteria bacterium]|nr:hypothetical protein [Gammaproteobacteria bacterium]
MGEQGSDTRYAHKESWAVIMASEVHNNGFYAAESGMAIVTGTPVSGCEKLAALFARHGVAKACLLSYQESGLGFLQNLEGAFSLVLYLKNESKYLLVRDRTGINQLYYAVGNRSIGFSTRLSSLYKNKSLKLEVDNQSVYEYLYHQVIPSPNTIYKDLYSLDPGSYVEIKGAARQVGQYWRVKYTQEHTRLNLQDLESEFIDVLYRS